jgi:putative ABC transport system ATP-binding protein
MALKGMSLSLKITALSHEVTDGDNHRYLFTDLSLSVASGECVALMGESGSGKTTLLNLIAGLEPIQQGEIAIANLPLSNASDKQLSRLRKQYLGIIFQQFNLLSSLSVQDNIEFSAKLSGRFDENHGLTLAKELGILSLLTKFPATLSGGEMQRVAIARALNAKPQLLLADEPTGNLDKNNSEHVVEQLVNLAKSKNTALLMVTHSLDVASSMDKIYRLVEGTLTLFEG